MKCCTSDVAFRSMATASGRRIPEATVARLPEYLRLLTESRDSGISNLSSEELADMAGVNAAKVRRTGMVNPPIESRWLLQG